MREISLSVGKICGETYAKARWTGLELRQKQLLLNLGGDWDMRQGGVADAEGGGDNTPCSSMKGGATS